MKQVRISKLMDEYTDTEFFPAGKNSADPEMVKSWVRANVKTLAPVKKEQMPKKKTLRLAVALAAVLVILVGAGFPQTVYQLFNGTVSFAEDADGKTISIITEGEPIKLEDGRLFLIQGDVKTDITDMISETRPYIMDNSKPDEDIVNYRILGGTPEHYGWFEWIMVPGPESFEDYIYEDGRTHVYNFGFTNVQDDEPYPVGGGGVCDPDWGIFDDFNKDAGIHIEDFQWLWAAAEELGIPFTDAPEENAAIISG